MSFDTLESVETNETVSDKEQNIKDAIKFAETVKLDDLQENEFNALKKVLDKISLQN